MTIAARARSPKTSARARSRSKGGAASTGPSRNLAESPLAWLYSRRDANGNPLISEPQFNAGEKLRADFWFAGMSPQVTQSWSLTAGTASGGRGHPGAAVDMADNAIAAAERVRRALAAVGPEHAGLLLDVCCHLKGLEDVEQRAGWPRRSAKIVLGMALAALARHYGLDVSARPSRAAVRHWGADGYRPTADGDAEADGV